MESTIRARYAWEEDAFGADEILELKAYETELVEGTGHAGMSALIDLVVRKA